MALSKLYPLIFKGVLVLSLVVGSFVFGRYTLESEYAQKISQIKLKFQEIEAKSAKINTVVVTEYVDRVEYIEKQGKSIIKEIPVYITKEVDSQCKIPNSVIQLHNQMLGDN